MDKIKPYIFWIVCGVLLIVEIAVMATVSPASEEYDSAAAAVAAADREFSKLRRVDSKAREVLKYDGGKVPSSPAIHPENEQEVDDFLKKHLIHQSWDAEFNKVVRAYQEQIAAIRDNLGQRSALLHEPIADDQNVGQWYYEYLNVTVPVLQKLWQADKVSLNGRKSDNVAVPTEKELEENESYRSVLGFYTKKKGNEFIDRDEIPLWTARFRVSNLIADLVLEAQAAIPPNPLLLDNQWLAKNLPESGQQQGIVLQGIDWGRRSRNRVVTGLPGAPDAEVHPFSVTVTGPPSAVHAFAALVDNQRSPLLIRTGSEWSRVGYDDKELMGAPVEHIKLRIDVAFVDFKNLGQ